MAFNPATVNADTATRQTQINYDLKSPLFLEADNQPPFLPIDTTTQSDFSNKTTNEPPKLATVPKMASLGTVQEKPLFKQTPSPPGLEDVTILDRDWTKQAFLVSDGVLTDGAGSQGSYYDTINRYWSSAANKFVDTRLGGNIGINARPQFTRYSDCRVRGRLMGRNPVSLYNVGGNYGMGRYYSEAIDDNAQTIYMRFGVPQFNSLASFFSKAFDQTAVSLARTGAGPGFLYRVGQLAGTIASVTAFPVMTAVIMGGRMMSFFFTRPTSKFYTMKPTMHLYWSAVQSLVNTIAANKGLIPRVESQFLQNLTGTNNDPNQKIGNPYKFDEGYLQQLHTLMPDMFTDDYGIDVFAIASKAQRIANLLNETDYNNFNVGSNSDFIGKVQLAGQTIFQNPDGADSLSNWLDHFLKFGSYSNYYTNAASESRLEINPKINQNQTDNSKANIDPNTGLPAPVTVTDKYNGDQVAVNDPKIAGFWEFFDAEFRQGSGFAVFKVDHTGAVSEAFANSATESDLSQKFNGASSQVREAKFSLSDGNITGTAAEGVVKDVAGAAVDVIKGTAAGLTFGLSNIFATAGSGYIDIPKHWQSSSASLPRTSYSMQLISPYGNLISQMQNIFIPLAMIMAAALPLATGKQSYTSPFLCQLWDRGRQQIQLGMIESLSITRGTCNLPFTNKGNVLAIDVSFTVADMSSIMSMPISSGGLFGSDADGNPVMDEDNILYDYLAVLAGQDMYSQIYAIPKAKLNFAKTLMSFEKLTSPAYWASWVHESATSGFLEKVTLGAGDLLEGLVQGSNVASNNQR